MRGETGAKTILDYVWLLVRLVLGAHFVWMGWVKVLEPVGFLKLVRQYEMINHPGLLNFVAAALPWFEVFCGLLLLLGVARRGTSLLLLLMLLPFTAVVLRRALEIAAAKGLPFCAVSFDCGCGAGEVFICHKLLENTLLIAASTALLLAGRADRWSLRPKLFP